MAVAPAQKQNQRIAGVFLWKVQISIIRMHSPMLKLAQYALFGVTNVGLFLATSLVVIRFGRIVVVLDRASLFESLNYLRKSWLRDADMLEDLSAIIRILSRFLEQWFQNVRTLNRLLLNLASFVQYHLSWLGDLNEC